MAYQAIVKGYVQGVGFRRVAKQIADHKGLQGSVRNLSDGSVEIILNGSRSDLEQFICEIGQRLSAHAIESVAIEVYSSSSLFLEFLILPGS